jgi:hypothetical protein
MQSKITWGLMRDGVGRKCAWARAEDLRVPVYIVRIHQIRYNDVWFSLVDPPYPF